jgi:hypothetical protein
MADIVLHDAGHCFFNLMDPGIAVFIHPAAGSTDDMIVLFALMGLFELGYILPELVLDDQPAIEQQFHRIVKGSPAHPVIVVFHVDIEFLHIEMAFLGINLIEDSKPFGCLALSFSFDILRKDLFYSSLDG